MLTNMLARILAQSIFAAGALYDGIDMGVERPVHFLNLGEKLS